MSHMDLDADKERKLLEESLFSVRLRAKNNGSQAQLLAHRRDCGVTALVKNARSHLSDRNTRQSEARQQQHKQR